MQRETVAKGFSPHARWALLALAVATTHACEAASAPTLEEAVSRISADKMRAHVSVLAHDSMRGRDTDDIGFVMARDYVAAEFGRMGLQPINGDSYLQEFDLLELVADRGSRVTIGREFIVHPEAIITPDWLGQIGSISGDGVYVGNGLVTAGVDGTLPFDLKGKIAFVLAGPPEGLADDPTIAMNERAEVELALRAGAIAVVVLNPDVSPAAWAARAQSRRPTRVLADGTSPTPRPNASLGPSSSRRLLQRWETGAVGRVAITAQHELRTTTSWNVGGFWPGADPDRSGDVVVFTAHLDHVGIGEANQAGDSIYNGAHDNALGVANVLAAADALAGSRLPRSVMFLATGAEESGLLGSWYYVRNPLFPLERTVASINHDGGLASGAVTDDVFAWGPEFSTLSTDLERAASATNFVVNPERIAPFGPSAGLLYRSDHYPFLITGVPVAYLMPGFSVGGDPDAGRRAWEEYLAGTHHAQADNFDPAAGYESPAAMTTLSVRLAWQLASSSDFPRTHDTAPIAKTRGEPSGFFFAIQPGGGR